MTTTPDIAADTTELIGGLDAGLAMLVATAVTNGILSAAPITVGDHTTLVTRPYGWTTTQIDVRQHEDLPRFRTGHFEFLDVDSFALYIERYSTKDTIAYAHDRSRAVADILGKDATLITTVIDDLPADGTANRAHTARLLTRPTVAARRWSKALDTTLTQEQFLELIDDGIGEIAAPEAASLRDLIADLHAIRSTGIHSVIRTGGGTTVEVSDVVALHSGKGTTIEVPGSMTVVFPPFTMRVPPIVVEVKIRPVIQSDRVLFKLTAPALEEMVADTIRVIVDGANDETGLTALWVP